MADSLQIVDDINATQKAMNTKIYSPVGNLTERAK